ncbi:RimJ/RimL family protein N-acetyltransferase [Brevibacillus fulvus]|uniref:RimJ/RimL family protein N-acetyltransferase n=1 Tax=Brevibacillus fulvus TaxID=1125967 RepID=A0A938Y122_9BACL|nr:RimJ/RimL family protein N-acetyltransferase [Brevibacillus fulvus]
MKVFFVDWKTTGEIAYNQPIRYNDLVFSFAERQVIAMIETPRLILRPYQEDDFAAAHAMFADPETMQFYPAPFSSRHTKAWISRNRERYAKDGFGLWAVCLKQSGIMIGDCGLIKQNLADQTEVEIGYHLNKAYWGNGYATEAALACKQYGFETLGLPRLISIIVPRNRPSIRVAERIGFSFERMFHLFGKDHCIYVGIRSALPMPLPLDRRLER